VTEAVYDSEGETDEKGNRPIVGIVVTISPSFNLYRMVVFPAASRPTIKIRISFFPHSLSSIFEIDKPMMAGLRREGECQERRHFL
jgi:hypothetical protein